MSNYPSYLCDLYDFLFLLLDILGTIYRHRFMEKDETSCIFIIDTMYILYISNKFLINANIHSLIIAISSSNSQQKDYRSFEIPTSLCRTLRYNTEKFIYFSNLPQNLLIFIHLQCTVDSRIMRLIRYVLYELALQEIELYGKFSRT